MPDVSFFLNLRRLTSNIFSKRTKTMKLCPTCQKTFEDSMRFCQIDGTPLVDATETEAPPDPFKTRVGNFSEKGEHVLQSTEDEDSKKTIMVSPDSEMDAPELPRFDGPGLNSPNFGDLSGGSTSSRNSSGSSPFNEPPAFGSSPFSVEGSSGQSPFDKSESAPIPSPFEKSTPAYKEPEQMFGSSQPQPPFGQAQDQYNQPFQQNEWNPPPAPVANWQEQGLGANTAFSPPVSAAEDKTLAIVSLVCGILSLICCGPVTGIAALITGYMAKNNVDSNPQQYGGRGMALAGMIMGAISLVLTVLYFIFVGIVGFTR